MPKNVLGNTAQYVVIQLDTTSFVQKPYLRTKFVEIFFEEDIDMKNQFEVKNLPGRFSPQGVD